MKLRGKRWLISLIMYQTKSRCNFEMPPIIHFPIIVVLFLKVKEVKFTIQQAIKAESLFI
jgi:hypothetical protein